MLISQGIIQELFFNYKDPIANIAVFLYNMFNKILS